VLADYSRGALVLDRGAEEVSRLRARVEEGTYTHAKSTAKVIENDPGAGVARVIHGDVWLLAGMIEAKERKNTRCARRVGIRIRLMNGRVLKRTRW
jgi:hypothetical protein